MLAVMIGASESPSFNPLGDNLLPLLILALAAAMVFGNVTALVRPPEAAEDGDLRRAPIARTLVMIAIGLIGAIWSVASLLSG